MQRGSNEWQQLGPIVLTKQTEIKIFVILCYYSLVIRVGKEVVVEVVVEWVKMVVHVVVVAAEGDGWKGYDEATVEKAMG